MSSFTKFFITLLLITFLSHCVLGQPKTEINNCWDEIFNKGNITFECFKKVMAKILGYTIVFGSAIAKLPQIYNIFKHKSTQGISDLVLYVEAIGYLTAFFYPLHYGLPFSSYGETLFLSIQSFCLVLMLWHFNKSRFTKSVIITSLSVYLFYGLCLFFGNFIPDIIWSILYVVFPQGMIYSRIHQIFKNYQAKNTGTLSLIMYTFYTGGNLIRVFTTLVEAKDWIMFANFTIGLTINSTIVIQILYYWKYGRHLPLSKKQHIELNKIVVKKEENSTRNRSNSEEFSIL